MMWQTMWQANWQTRRSCGRAALALALLVASACQSPAGELESLAALPPLDYAALVTGGAFLSGPPPDPDASRLEHTFATPEGGDEPIPITDFVTVLNQGKVFRHVAEDEDAVHRRAVLEQLALDAPGADPALRAFLLQARNEGYDLLLVVEQLQDGPVDQQGVNSRWPLTLSTWLLFGLGMLIPDHTFESDATLRITVRDVETGRKLLEQGYSAGPVDLSLVERGNFLGILLSILVPPFWVYNDDDNVASGVASVSMRRLLLSVARDLKSQPTRQFLREGGAAVIELSAGAGVVHVDVHCEESVSQIRLRLDGRSLPTKEFEQKLLSSVQPRDGRFHYRAAVDQPLAGERLQVLVRTISGGIASITVDPGEL